MCSINFYNYIWNMYLYIFINNILNYIFWILFQSDFFYIYFTTLNLMINISIFFLFFYCYILNYNDITNMQTYVIVDFPH